jgi:putative ABC transport system permease protein
MRAILEALRLSWRALSSYRTRALLTMLGISIGIFSITFIFTLVNTLQYAISKNLAELGNTVMFVHHWPWMDSGDNWYKYFNRPKVSYADYSRLKNNLQRVVGVDYQIRRSGINIKGPNGKSVQMATVMGVTYDYNVINVFNMEDGRFFTETEVEGARPVCVVGYSIAEALFGQGPYVGQTLKFRGRQLRVIGVMEKQGSNPFGGSRDEVLLIPYTTATTMLNANSRQVDKVIAVKAEKYEELDQVEGDVIGQIRKARGIKPSVENNFAINRQEMLMTGLQNIFSTIRTGGIIISIFSLLVGGFGIANIMFVSVKERTSEIGVQRALGSTKAFILAQFLFESVMLCVMGGLAGMAFMLVVSGLAQVFLDQIGMLVTVQVIPGDLVLGVVISIVIGLIAGFLPANTAANLDPVEAIRQQ